MTMAAVTILMSTYNRRRFLPAALESVRRQPFRDWLLLVVNDGGEDVADLIDACHDVRIRYFNRPHLGKAAQLNFALGQVESKYIGYMDDDDEADPSHREGLYRAAEESGSEFVCSDVKVAEIDADGQTHRSYVLSCEGVCWQDIRLFNRINHSTILHAKSLSDRVGGYDERMRILIDFDYIKRLCAVVRPLHVQAAAYTWKLRAGKDGRYQSISGLWDHDPTVAGRSLLAFFDKDPEALSLLYRGERQKIDGLAAIVSQQSSTITRQDAEILQLRASLGQAQAELQIRSDELAAAKVECTRLDSEVRSLSAAYSRIENATFWRMTKPMRVIVDWLKKGVKRMRRQTSVHEGGREIVAP